MEIRRVREGEGMRVRDFRLRALKADSDAFASTLAEEEARPASDWEERARRVAQGESAVTFVAELDTAWVGMVFAFMEHVDPDAADVAGLWVDPIVRGHGVGHQLLDAVLAWAREHATRQVRLWVTETNDDAIALYRSYGFQDTGHSLPLRSNPALATREMVLTLPASVVGGD